MHISCAVCTLPKAGPSLGSSTALLPLLCPPGLAKSIMGGNNIPGRNFHPKREPFPIPLVLFSVLVVSLRSTFWISPGAACRGQEYPWKIALRGTTTPIPEGPERHRDVSLTLAGAAEAGGTPGTHRVQLGAFWSTALLAAQPPKF